MKATILALAFSSSLLAIPAQAQSALGHVSAESIKSTLSRSQIEQSLEQWKQNQFALLEKKADAISHKAPIEARRELAKKRIEREYNQMTKVLGLYDD